MSIWLTKADLEDLNTRYAKTLVQHLGIEFIEIGNDYIKARMHVDHRTKQPAGILHGGASVALAETLGSIAANLCVDRDRKICVGLEINANHIRQVRSGFVYGIARPIHIGNTTQLWDIRIQNEEDKLVCISRLTVAVLNKAHE